jgi:acyl carrier protein
MEQQSIEDRVKAAVARIFGREAGQLSRDTRFIEDLMAKSLNIIELTAVLENEFGIEIPFIEARRRKTIGEAIELVERLVGS